jgi:hypothetical protein
MAPPTTAASAAQDDREGLSPSPQPYGLVDIWDDDDDDIEFEPASEQSEPISQDDTEVDNESEYMGIIIFWMRYTLDGADLE